VEEQCLILRKWILAEQSHDQVPRLKLTGRHRPHAILRGDVPMFREKTESDYEKNRREQEIYDQSKRSQAHGRRS
jgi:hypothetical protein